MSKPPLSQNQAESLLRTVNAAEASKDHSVTFRVDPSHDASAAQQSDSPDNHQPVTHQPVTRESVDCVTSRSATEAVAEPYDFRRPTQLNRDQVQALQVLCDVMATQFSDSAQSLLRGDIECQLVNVDQCSHQDFVYQLDNPSCFCVIDPKPLTGQWMMDIPSKLLFAMIDRMLGGEPYPGDVLQRAMTDIEQRLMRRVIESFLVNVREAWQRVSEIDPLVSKIENHPHCVASTSIHAAMVRVQFAAKICSVRGHFWLAMPISTINHLSDRLDSCRWESEMCQLPTEQTRKIVTHQLADSPIDVVVNLARSTINTRDLLGLTVGDVITTEQPVSEPMELSIAKVPKYKVRAGAYQKKVAVQIESTQ